MPGPNDPNTEEELDTKAALEEISSELFGQGDGEEASSAGEEPSSVEPQAVPASTAAVEQPEAQTPEGNSPEVQALGAPDTWTKEAIAEWAKIPPRVQEEIRKREEDMKAGISQYREKADLGTRYDAAAAPFKEVLTQSGVDPVELFQNFAANHYLLTFGQPQQKLQIAANLIQHYGVDPQALFSHLSGMPPLTQEMREMRGEIQALRSAEASRERQNAMALESQANSEITAFAADPANTHFHEVSADMAVLIRNGVCNTLQEAYDKAVWANPKTRQIELDRAASDRAAQLEAERVAKLNTAKSKTSINVSSSAKTRDGAIPVGSMEDTLNDTYAAIKARG